VTRAFAVRLAALAAVVLVAAVCGQPQEAPKGMPGYTDHYAMRITSDPAPPRARQRTTFKIVVRDKETNEPISGGEGVLYGNTKDPNVKVWDTFVVGAEPGTYYANVNYIVATDWAMGLRFRKDSTQKLEQVDWMQSVNNASGEVR
jgi:hypothetical protein